MEKLNDKQIAEQIENDFKFILEWQGIEWDETQEVELKRLIKTNTVKFREHLEKYGDISDFQYD